MEEKREKKINLFSVILILIILILIAGLVCIFIENKKLNQQLSERNNTNEITNNTETNSINTYKVENIKNIYDAYVDEDSNLIKAQKIVKELIDTVNNKDWYYLAKIVGTDADDFIKYDICNYNVNVDDYQELGNKYVFNETYETTIDTKSVGLGKLLIITFEDSDSIKIDVNCTGL